jgi:hypothetical protein
LPDDFVNCTMSFRQSERGVLQTRETASPENIILIAVPAMSAQILPETAFPNGDLWVFGYGSLMWRPGFDFVEQVPARLIGEHRALCVYSFVHRGTPGKPGLVLGLDRGGACRGVAFRVAAKHRTDVVAYLREREQVTSVYREVLRSVWLTSSIAVTSSMPAGSHWRSSCATCDRVMDARVPTRNMWWPP